MYILEIIFIVFGALALGFVFLSIFTPLGRGPAIFSLKERISFLDESFFTVMEGVSRTIFQQGGLPTTLDNGDEFFPALIADIASAKHTINIAVYILRPGEDIGKEILALLVRKSREGIRVRLLLDSRGSSSFNKKAQIALKKAGIKVVMFRPFSFGVLTQFDKRNHCRAFIIDGKVAYTGGIAIGQEWTGNAQNRSHWRDMMFRFTGKQAGAVQRVFSTLWANTCGEVLSGDDIYPKTGAEVTESKWISIMSSPSLETNLLRTVYWVSCMAAMKNVYIRSPYFVPDKHMRKVFIEKVQQGLEILLMLPNQNDDEKMAYHAGRFFYDELLSAGVKIYEFQPTMIHAKTFLADDCWSIIGSANMDVRSQELNEENIIGILSSALGREQHERFYKDLEKCKEITLDVWRNRPIYDRFLEYICVLLGHQL